MLSNKILEILNRQLNRELFSALLYKQLSPYANAAGLLGVEAWLNKQFHEEVSHFEKVCEYIIDRNYEFEISSTPAPNKKLKTLLDIFEAALAHEKFITKSLEEVRALAIEEDDQLTEIFIIDMLKEQIEEEAQVFDILAQAKLAGDNSAAILMIDKKLGDR